VAEADFVLKLELLQHAGSFKGEERLTICCPKEARPPELSPHQGNHGVAVAFAAPRLGQVAEIFVPTISSPVKIDFIGKYGAKVTILGANYPKALEASQRRRELERGVNRLEQPKRMPLFKLAAEEWLSSLSGLARQIARGLPPVRPQSQR
jgi:threonine dehydratase